MSKIGPLPRLRIYTTVGQYRDLLVEALAGRRLRGDAVKELERQVSSRVGTTCAVAMPQARVGIYLAIKHLVKPGQKVILSPYTISDVVNMVVCAGAVPVFADIERETCNIDAAEVEKLIDSDTGAVMVTHFYGLACDIERIADICKVRGVPLIEDAAQAFGVRVNGRAVGTFGDVGIYSFGLFKNVNSFLGGMIVGNDQRTFEAIEREMSAYPYQPASDFFKKAIQGVMTDLVTWPLSFRMGFFWLFRYAFLNDVTAVNDRMKNDINPVLKTEIPESYLCKMTPLQARMALRQLDNVEVHTQRRIEAAKRYYKGLRDIPELILPPMRTDVSHMYWYYPIQFDRRYDLVGYAMRHFRDISESYHHNCADLPCFAQWYRDCPNARATAGSLIYLPTYPRYPDHEIDETVKVIRNFFGR